MTFLDALLSTLTGLLMLITAPWVVLTVLFVALAAGASMTLMWLVDNYYPPRWYRWFGIPLWWVLAILFVAVGTYMGANGIGGWSWEYGVVEY